MSWAESLAALLIPDTLGVIAFLLPPLTAVTLVGR